MTSYSVCVFVHAYLQRLYRNHQFGLFEVNLPGLNFTSGNSFYVFSTSSTAQVAAVATAKTLLHCLARIQ